MVRAFYAARRARLAYVQAHSSAHRRLGARITGVYVVDPREYDKAVEAQAAKALARLEREARGAKLRCATQPVTAAQPWQGILRVARASRCDALVIAYARVLAHSKFPVLVIR